MNGHTGALLTSVVPSSCNKGDRMNWKSLVLACAILLIGTGWAEAQCVVDTSTPTYDNGKFLRYVPCDATGAQKTTGSGGSADGTIIDGVSATIKATVKDYTNSNPLAIIPVDTNGDPASLTGGTQYAEDAAETAGAQLNMSGSVRRDTAASSAGTTGDNATINTDATGRLWTRPTGAVTPATSFSNPTDAMTVWALNGCHNGTTWDPCVKASSGAGAVDSGTARVTTASDDPINVGTSNNHHLSVGTTEDETEIKATAGVLKSIQVSNVAATVAYLRCANLTAANTTPGTSTIFWGMAVPGATTGAGLTAQIGGVNGLAFSTALTCWVVTGKAATDVAEVGANDVEWNIQYK